ncbi:helix-turn-helix domain-containing protein [Saccharopolyspora griseoalba]|uniref:Helix-turn-helix domain-containing protein n=1 Tax=Saccharopolyspora griseoalba TaxID=1431848 RepID=A0ABW2LBH5_9PSEU
MGERAESVSAAIGDRVKSERRARGWTLDELVRAAGISRRMLINIEQGAANPSIATLLSVGDALGLGLPALVEVGPAKPVKVTRNGSAAVLWTGPGGGSGVLVAGTEPPDVVELWDWTLAPGDRHDSEAHARGTKELIHVHDGAITVDVEGRSVRLEAGDAVAFPGDVDHSYGNQSTGSARFSLAVFEPGVGTGPGVAASDA